MAGSAIAALRHLIGAAFVELVGNRHGDSKRRDQGGGRHNRDGDPFACHAMSFPLKERPHISPRFGAVVLKMRNDLKAMSG